MNAMNTDYLQLVELATRAPSGHNTQPWLFRIGEKEITILPDLTKELPVVDNDRRELYISLGCATENLCIAASAAGYRTEVSIEAPAEQPAAIHISLEKSADVLPSPLYPAIEKRQTNRSVYNGQAIPEKSLEALTVIAAEPGIHFHLWKNGTKEFTALKALILKGNDSQMNDPAFKEELQAWMRYNKKHSEATRNGLSYAVFGAPNLPAFLSKAIMGSFLNSTTQNKGDRKKIASSSHLVLFTTPNNTVKEWISLGRTLQRFLLTATQENIAAAFLNQPCEVKELAEEIQQKLPINKEYPALLLRVGYAKDMPYSLRQDIKEVITEGNKK